MNTLLPKMFKIRPQIEQEKTEITGLKITPIELQTLRNEQKE